MDTRLTCWRCHEIFSSDHEYDFPKKIVYWHKCSDGVMTQIPIIKEKKRGRFVPSWVKEPTAKEMLNRKLYEIYGQNIIHKIEEDENG